MCDGTAGTFLADGTDRMRSAILLSAFLPFLYYASKDAVFHFRGRRVTLIEHLLHLAIGVALAIVLVNAVAGNFGVMLVGLVFFIVAGGIAEFVWHRGIPEQESDLHAKEHLALLLFVVAALVVHWLENHQWRLPQELLSALSVGGWPAQAIVGQALQAGRTRRHDRVERFVEVKRRVGERGLALTPNKWINAQRAGEEYRRYVDADCKTNGRLYVTQDPTPNLNAGE